MYIKDFDSWNGLKKETDAKVVGFVFKDKEIWWCRFGLNIGSEQNGIGDNFERPVVIIKKLSKTTFLCAPLSTKNKMNKFQSEINTHTKGYALIDQIKVLDIKRLQRKISDCNEIEFKTLKIKLKDLYF